MLQLPVQGVPPLPQRVRIRVGRVPVVIVPPFLVAAFQAYLPGTAEAEGRRTQHPPSWLSAPLPQLPRNPQYSPQRRSNISAPSGPRPLSKHLGVIPPPRRAAVGKCASHFPAQGCPELVVEDPWGRRPRVPPLRRRAVKLEGRAEVLRAGRRHRLHVGAAAIRAGEGTDGDPLQPKAPPASRVGRNQPDNRRGLEPKWPRRLTWA